MWKNKKNLTKLFSTWLFRTETSAYGDLPLTSVTCALMQFRPFEYEFPNVNFLKLIFASENEFTFWYRFYTITFGIRESHMKFFPMIAHLSEDGNNSFISK